MKNRIGLVMILLVVFGCSPSSRITSSWKKARLKTGYTEVLIASLTSNIEAKTIIEQDLASALTNRGAITLKSMDVFAPNFTKEIGREEMMKKIRNTPAQAIITVSLIHKATTSHYVPGYPYYGGFWGYYSSMYPMVYGPGYYQQDRIYFMETNVYDAHTEELVWSAHSETYNPQNLSGFSHELANILAGKLIKDHIIEPFKKFGRQDKNIISKNH